MTKLAILIAIATATATAATTAACHRSGAPAPATDPTAAVRAELDHRRTVAIEWLHDYRAAGVYPTDAAGMPIGVFRDDHGVRCPMSELIFRSGRGDLVDHVVATDNRLRLADVHDGPLMDWILASGLTHEEVVMIQGVLDLSIQLPVDNRLPAANEVRIAARHEVGRRLADVEQRLRDGHASLDLAVARAAKVGAPLAAPATTGAGATPAARAAR